MDIVLATRNRKKVEEMKRMFSGHEITFKTLDAFPGCPEVDEDGQTFQANAKKKALTIARYTGCPALADDSGLEVKALDSAPGVFSARYAGEHADDKRNVKKILREMRTVITKKERKARFVCCIAFALPDGTCRMFTGYVSGTIAATPKGYNGFGYDPIFYPIGHDRTFAEMADIEKDALSHRGRAMKKLYTYLRSIL
ncbi:MAG: XTP/dITP diphosphatase [Nitrospirota bacterium]|nr:XTP/dITP diphosphatase [Nitrospirota bacterium]